MSGPSTEGRSTFPPPTFITEKTKHILPRPSHVTRLPAALLLLLAALALAPNSPAQTPSPRAAAPPLLVGYFGQWGVYDGIFPKSLVTSGAAAALDQLNYAQGFVTDGHCSVADPNADLHLTLAAADSINHRADSPTAPFRGNLHQLAELKRLHPHLKILISLEGKADDFAADARPEHRAAFVRSCVDLFLRGHLAPGVTQPRLFDGIDLDWEYPHGDDAANFLALVTELRRAMDAARPGLRLAVAVGASPRMVEGVDIPAVARLVDQVGVMNYDYHGPWNPATDFLAPLFADGAGGPNSNAGSVARSLEEWQAVGVPRAKLLLGLPFYGYGWEQVAGAAHGFQQSGHAIRGDRPYSFFATLTANALAPAPTTTPIPPAIPNSEKPPTAPTRGNVRELVTDQQLASPTNAPPANASPTNAPPINASPTNAPPINPSPTTPAPFTLFRDPRSQAPWLYDGSTFWTFEDPVSIRFKAAFARDQQLGGVMIWELGEDTPDGALVHAAHQGLRHGAPPAPTQTTQALSTHP